MLSWAAAQNLVRPSTFLLASLLAIYTICVLWPEPRFVSGLLVFLFLLPLAPAGFSGHLLFAVSAGYLIVPALLLALVSRMSTPGASASGQRGLLAALSAIAVVAAIDTVLSALLGAFGTGGSANVQAIVAASIFAWTVVLRSSAANALGVATSRSRESCIGGFAVAILMISAWSAGSGLTLAFKAAQIAHGRPYCLVTDDGTPYEAVNSIFDLRGTNFYTEFTGYKDTSRWYYHGVLVVDRGHGLAYWNWSKRALRFDPLSSAAALERAPDCDPERNFVRRLLGYS